MRKRNIWTTLLAVGMAIGCSFAVACGEGETPSPAPEQEVALSYGLNEVEIELEVGKTFDLDVIADGTITKPVSWESENASIATVDVNGLVTANGVGETRIFARVDGKRLTATVKIVEKWEIVPQIALDGEIALGGSYSFTLIQGESYTITPVLKTDKKLDGVSFTVTSENPALSVNGYTLTGVSVATGAEVEISCEYQSQSYSITAYVTVVEEA